MVSDVSSNTVSILVSGGRIAGAIDACIFAPGTTQGAIDVDAIRKIDRGEITANRAFMQAGVNFTLPEGERKRALALYSAMECAALRVLSPQARIALAGTCAPLIAAEVETLLGEKPAVFDEWCAARGLARIARDVFGGREEYWELACRCNNRGASDSKPYLGSILLHGPFNLPDFLISLSPVRVVEKEEMEENPRSDHGPLRRSGPRPYPPR